MRENVLHVENITMQFGGVVAVNNLTMDVGRGEIVALIGPNGAGKTTAFNVITGVYEPTNGSISFFQKPEFQGVQKSDINAEVSSDRFSYPLVMNGKFLPNYIQFTDETERKIQKKINDMGRKLDDVIFCYIDSSGEIQVIFKGNK